MCVCVCAYVCVCMRMCVCSAWCRGVLAMVWDQETSIQDRCLEVLESTLLANIAPRHRSGLPLSPAVPG